MIYLLGHQFCFHIGPWSSTHHLPLQDDKWEVGYPTLGTCSKTKLPSKSYIVLSASYLFTAFSLLLLSLPQLVTGNYVQHYVCDKVMCSNGIILHNQHFSHLKLI